MCQLDAEFLCLAKAEMLVGVLNSHTAYKNANNSDWQEVPEPQRYMALSIPEKLVVLIK